MYDITKVVQGIPFLLDANSLVGAGHARVSLREIARLINQEDLRVLKRLVERHSNELAELGEIVSLATVATGNSRQSSGVEDILLNTEQTVYLISRTETPTGRKLSVILVKAFTEMLQGYAFAHATGTPLRQDRKELPKLDVVSSSDVIVHQAKALYMQALKLQDYERLIGDLDSRLLAIELRELPTKSSEKEADTQHDTAPAVPPPSNAAPNAAPDDDPNTDPELNTAPVPVTTKDIPTAVRTAKDPPVPANTASPLSATHYTIRGFAQVRSLPLSDGKAQGLGRRATALCKKKKLKKHFVRDKRWGEVGYYPATVVKSIFADWYTVDDP